MESFEGNEGQASLILIKDIIICRRSYRKV